jgi:hypothetical protein
MAGQLTTAEFDDLRLTDLVLSGRRREDGAEVYLLVELAPSIRRQDVARATRRARILEKLGRPVLPIVGGKQIDPEAAALARASGVWQVVDGQTIAPK